MSTPENSAKPRTSFSEDDVNQILRDERILACIDIYWKGRVTFGEAKKLMFGNDVFTPFQLEWRAFHNLCVEIIKRMESGSVHLPPNFEAKFPDVYSYSSADKYP